MGNHPLQLESIHDVSEYLLFWHARVELWCFRIRMFTEPGRLEMRNLPQRICNIYSFLLVFHLSCITHKYSPKLHYTHIFYRIKSRTFLNIGVVYITLNVHAIIGVHCLGTTELATYLAVNIMGNFIKYSAQKYFA